MDAMANSGKERSNDFLEEECCSGPGLGDLPECCIAAILRFTTPKEVAVLACTSRVFWDASISDVVWESKLPPRYADILAQASNVPSNISSKKDVYEYLSTRALLQSDTEDYWLDRATGGVCRSIGARALNVVWGTDERYWLWSPHENARFSEVACLKQVCWFDVQGKLKSNFPPGTYTLSWRLLFGGDGPNRTFSVYGWDYKPVKFSFETIENQQAQRELYLTRHLPVSKYGKWMEIAVGEFVVEAGWDLPVEIQFSMLQTEDGSWKSGLFLDCVVIRPSFVKLENHLDEADTESDVFSTDDLEECEILMDGEDLFSDEDPAENAGGLTEDEHESSEADLAEDDSDRDTSREEM